MTLLFFFFFNDTATTEIYTLSLHDALPIYHGLLLLRRRAARLPHDRPCDRGPSRRRRPAALLRLRSEEHTSELQSRLHLVCRLLLEKKKTTKLYPKLTHKILPYNAAPVLRG